ncbi:MAG: 50S ribosomal protein L24 [Candidatus Diapherotrites archaeon]|nr:50S ribosomal protein L24 [Candidatus Diapherotrites archaeon]
MKVIFMNIESSKPKKQRKFFLEKALHLKQKSVSGHLSKELRKKTGRRSISMRKGDTVRIMTGKSKGKEAKITGVDYAKTRIFIEKMTRKKSDGTEIPVGINASNVLVVDLDSSDSKRFKKTAKKAKEA